MFCERPEARDNWPDVLVGNAQLRGTQGRRILYRRRHGIGASIEEGVRLYARKRLLGDSSVALGRRGQHA
jgi:hypothetical protein